MAVAKLKIVTIQSAASSVARRPYRSENFPLEQRADHEADQAARNKQTRLAWSQVPRLHHIMNDVGWIECIVAVKEHNHTDKQCEKAMVWADGSVRDFLAYIDHARHTQVARSPISIVVRLLSRISA